VNNALSDFYNYAKYHFIKKNAPQYLNKIKTIIWFRMQKNLTSKVIYNSIDAKIDFYFLLRIGFKKLKLKIFN